MEIVGALLASTLLDLSGCRATSVRDPEPPPDAAALGTSAPSAERPAMIGSEASPVAITTDGSDDGFRLAEGEDAGPRPSVSLGEPNAGALLGAVRLGDGDHWRVLYPDNAWGTAETISYLEAALSAAYERLPASTSKVNIGDLSSQWGGPLPPHLSHQSGRDVDIGYFRVDPENWYANASPRTLDVARTWILLRAFLSKADVEVIFIDRSLQRPLRAHALEIGEDRRWLDGLFESAVAPWPIIRHAPEHLNHLHVRFYNPEAQRLGHESRDPAATGLPRAGLPVIPARRVQPRRSAR
jgi:penicillin-insensitive murein endopeptidase